MNRRDRLRGLAHEVLRAEAGVLSVRRLCPRCGSDAHGAPHARTAVGPAPSVSLAYAGDLAVVAWGYDGPVGVDVERGGCDVEAWTRHEARAKATGHGLDAIDLPDLPVTGLGPPALPEGYVGTLAGVGAEWRLVCDTLDG